MSKALRKQDCISTKNVSGAPTKCYFLFQVIYFVVYCEYFQMQTAITEITQLLSYNLYFQLTIIKIFL